MKLKFIAITDLITGKKKELKLDKPVENKKPQYTLKELSIMLRDMTPEQLKDLK